MSAPKRVLILGATGQMGRLVTSECLASEGLSVRTLLRMEICRSAKQLGQLRLWRNQGLDIVPGDATHPGDLDEALRGVDVVVSALSPRSPQFRPIHDVLFAGMRRRDVRRLIPSDFCWDLRDPEVERKRQLTAKTEVAQAAERQGLAVTRVFGGCPIDNILPRRGHRGLIEHGVLPYWGSKQAECDFTSMRDTARYTTAAILDDGSAGSSLYFAGDRRTIRSLASVLSRYSGQHIRSQYRGTEEHFRALVQEYQGTESDDARMAFHAMVLSGQAVLPRIDNERYPWVMPDSVASYWSRTSREANSRETRDGMAPRMLDRRSFPASE